MMNSRKPLLTLLVSGSLLFAGSLLAQNQPMSPPPPPPTQNMPPPPPPTQDTPPPTAPTTAPAPSSQANASPQQAQVTINSSAPPVKDAGPPPDFAQLSGDKGYITEDEASAYPPLANDFLHASGGSKHLSKAAYARWLKQR